MKDYSSPLQVSSGYEAGSEAAIHSMKAIFEDDQAQGIILVDVSNAFNNMNRKVALQNIRIICVPNDGSFAIFIITNLIDHNFVYREKIFTSKIFLRTCFTSTIRKSFKKAM